MGWARIPFWGSDLLGEIGPVELGQGRHTELWHAQAPLCQWLLGPASALTDRHNLSVLHSPGFVRAALISGGTRRPGTAESESTRGACRAAGWGAASCARQMSTFVPNKRVIVSAKLPSNCLWNLKRTSPTFVCESGGAENRDRVRGQGQPASC